MERPPRRLVRSLFPSSRAPKETRSRRRTLDSPTPTMESIESLNERKSATTSPTASSASSHSSEMERSVSVVPVVSLGSGRFSLTGTVEDFWSTAPLNVESGNTGPRLHDLIPSEELLLDIVKSPTEQTSSRDDDDSYDDVNDTENTSTTDAAGGVLLQDMIRRSHCVRVSDLTLTAAHDTTWHVLDSPGAPNLETSTAGATARDDAWAVIPMAIAVPPDTMILNALADHGIQTLLNTRMWIPESKTRHILSLPVSLSSWEGQTFCPPQPLGATNETQSMLPTTTPIADHVLVWTGSFPAVHPIHGTKLYGSDIPAIRSAAVIAMAASSLVDLLVDSRRVQDYNSMSLGRTDVQIMSHHETDNAECSRPHRPLVTKILQSESRPPMLRKTLQFNTLFHGRQYANGYLLVSRAVTPPNAVHTNAASTVVSEILLGVNWIQPLEGTGNHCLLVTVNHISSPLVPLLIARRLGLQAAVNFVSDVRKCC